MDSKRLLLTRRKNFFAIRALRKLVEAHTSPIFGEEDLLRLCIKTSPMAFDTQGDPDFDSCFFQPFPIGSLHEHPAAEEMEFDEFDPEEKEPTDPLEDFFPDPIDRARFTMGYFRRELRVPRVGMPDGQAFREFSTWESVECASS